MDHPLIGRTVERRYEVTALLREGGGGAVLRAFDRMMQREVALRLFAPADADASRRFHRDSRIAARVRHPNVLEIHDTVRVDGADGIVGELAAGPSLGERVRAAGSLSASETAAAMRQAAAGVGAGHRWGLVHGALGPEQLLLSPAEGDEPFRVRVTGVGLGGAPRPGFAAPEVAAGADPSPASDVYALAALGAFALTGAPPAPDAAGMLRLPHDVSAGLAGVLERGLAADPAERFPDAEAFAAAVAESPMPRSPHARAQPGVARGMPLAPVGLALAVLLSAGVYLAFRSQAPSVPEDSAPPAVEALPGVADPAAAADDGGSRDLELSEVAVEPRPLNTAELARRLNRSYPPLLRDAGVSGRVHVRFAVDTDGRVDPESVEVISATHASFVEPTVAALRDLRFSPARVAGDPVRVRVELPIEWRVTR